VTWAEAASDTFTARFDERDLDETQRVLAQLEFTRERLEPLFGVQLGELAVVVHPSAAQLFAAQPWLVAQRRLTAPAGRRYLVGWAGAEELDVLSPRVLAQRASNVPGSLELIMLAPSALLARRIVMETHPELRPPMGPRKFRSWLRTAWLIEGAAQYFSGQTRHVRPAVRTRLAEGGRPDFPPSVRDAPVLAGTVFDLLAREEGERACVTLARGPHPDGAHGALEQAFHGRPLRHTEDAWRHHLERLASAKDGDHDGAGQRAHEDRHEHDGEDLDPRRRRQRRRR
jgi:hypothetical protein